MDVSTARAGWVRQRTFSGNVSPHNLVATQREAPMKRLATSLGTLIALAAMASVGPSRFLHLLDRRPPVSCRRRRGIAGLLPVCAFHPIAGSGRRTTPYAPAPPPARSPAQQPACPVLRSGRRQRPSSWAPPVPRPPSGRGPHRSLSSCRRRQDSRRRAPIRREFELPRMDPRRPSWSIRRAWSRQPSLRGPRSTRLHRRTAQR
jgi:hypothetical protein